MYAFEPEISERTEGTWTEYWKRRDHAGAVAEDLPEDDDEDRLGTASKRPWTALEKIDPPSTQ